MAKKKKSTKRDSGISLKISDEEREYLHNAANAAGNTSTSGWIMAIVRKEAEKLLGVKSPALTKNRGADNGDRKDK